MDQVADQELIQRVGGDDAAVRIAGLIQHPSRLLGEKGDVSAVDPDAFRPDAQRLQHFVEYFDGVRHAGFEHVIGIDQQQAVGGIGLRIFFERLIFGREKLHPAVSHGADGGDAVIPVGDRAGGRADTGDIGGTRAEDGGLRALRTAGTELHDCPALRRVHDAGGFGCDHGLMIERQQRHRLHELRLNDRALYDHDRLARKDRRALRNRPDVAHKFEMPEVIQKLLAEDAFSAEIRDILLLEREIFVIHDQLFQPGTDGEAAVIRNLPEKHIKDDFRVAHPFTEIAVRHGHLVEICEHAQIVSIPCHILSVSAQLRQIFL